jgi:tetratricopeptide (TPR) repeat protein
MALIAGSASARLSHAGAVAKSVRSNSRPLIRDCRRSTASGAAAARVPGLVRLPLLLLGGRWAEARAGLAEVRADGPVMWRQWAAGLLGPLARAQGDAALAGSLVREWLPAGPATEPGDSCFAYCLPLLRLAAALAVDAGDPVTAGQWLAAQDRWLAWSGAVLGQAEGALGWAAYHRAAGEPARAREHAERALAHASDPRQPLALLAAHRLLGELATRAGQQAEAQAQLAQALALAEGCATPYERALTLLSLAELHAATGRREGARALLGEVRAICTPLEAKPALARAASLEERLAAERPPARAPSPGT